MDRSQISESGLSLHDKSHQKYIEVVRAWHGHLQMVGMLHCGGGEGQMAMCELISSKAV